MKFMVMHKHDKRTEAYAEILLTVTETLEIDIRPVANS